MNEIVRELVPLLPDPPSRAAEYFKTIAHSHDPAALLNALINSTPPTFEDAWLDFKSGEMPDEKLKEIWSRALGAMANTEGGVLIWGINAAKDRSTKVDAANALRLCPDVNSFTTRLKELQHMITDPPVMGVEVFPVPSPGPAGFVVCHIPRSRFKPHRSEADGKQFYVRIQDHSEIPSVTWLRRMFMPEFSPRIVATMKAKMASPRECFEKGNLPVDMGFEAWLENRGNGTAYEVFAVLTTSRGIPEYDISREHTGRSWRAVSTAIPGQGLAAHRSIHPEEMAEIQTVSPSLRN